MNISRLLFLGLALGCSGAEARPSTPQDLRKDFSDPPLRWKSRPLWFWNGPLSRERTAQTLEGCKAAGYAGVGILPGRGMTPAFMTPEFLDHYRFAVEKAAELGLKLCLYDEYWFPSGSAGGLLRKKYPEALSKRLDMAAVDVTGPKAVEVTAPAGVFMGAAALEAATRKRVVLTDRVREGKLTWDAPAGEWKVMVFACVPDGGGNLVDYLDPAAVQRFVELTYQAYYDAFPSHFGTTIDSAFYDEPTFHWIKGGRAWTPAFNEKFRKATGADPVPLYPALWFDIGPETAAARNALLGFRAELFAAGFSKVLNDWCRAHKVRLTGHVDQEEVVNPVGLCGDLMKSFKYQDMPCIDQIFAYGRASKAYKVVSSAANNYDRPLVATECYGAIKDMPVENLYKEAMDQYAKGINVMVPHAVWYDPKKGTMPPDLTPGSDRYGPQLPEYNRYVGRCQRLLQGGRHVADIGVLYPIAGLQAAYHFEGPRKPYEGGVIPPEADYMDLGDRLALQVRRDFTFVHPEVLEERCRVDGAEIRLDNRENPERYRVFILPGSRAIPWGSLRKVKEFWDNGGKVIATTRLPEFSAEAGKDGEVRAAIGAMFGETKSSGSPRVTASSSWKDGGHEAALAADGDPATRWNAADGDRNPQWIEVDFGEPVTVARTVVREAFDRTRAWRIEAWAGGKWVECAKGERLGAEKADTFAPVKASKVRLCIDAIASDSASVAEIEILDESGRNLVRRASAAGRSNSRGGKAVFLPAPTAAALKAALDEALPVPDVSIDGDAATRNGNLSCIHKVLEGRDVYFFANSSDAAVDVPVKLRGRLSLERWDPHTGEIGPCEAVPAGETTGFRLKLDPVRSVFILKRISP
jgi:hypothetical protein